MRIPPALIALCATLQLQAMAAPSSVVVRSPDSADTYSDNSMQWHQLRWDARSQQLIATITFSNGRYVSNTEPRHDETFNFRIPGVNFSPETGVFTLRRAGRAPVPIATLKKGLFVASIVPAPNVQFQVLRKAGHYELSAVVSDRLIADERWTEVPGMLTPLNSRTPGRMISSY